MDYAFDFPERLSRFKVYLYQRPESLFKISEWDNKILQNYWIRGLFGPHSIRWGCSTESAGLLQGPMDVAKQTPSCSCWLGPKRAISHMRRAGDNDAKKTEKVLPQGTTSVSWDIKVGPGGLDLESSQNSNLITYLYYYVQPSYILQ